MQYSENYIISQETARALKYLYEEIEYLERKIKDMERKVRNLED